MMNRLTLNSKMQVPFEYYFIALSTIAGFAVLIKGKLSPYLRLFPFFLLIALFTEIVGWRLSLQRINNAALYNFFSVAAFLYYMYIIRYVVLSSVAKKVILLTMIIYAIISLFNILFIQKLDSFHTLTYSIGCFLIVVVSIYYFYELLQVPRSVNLLRVPVFWIAAGLLFFYICTLPILGALNFIFTFPRVILGSIEQIITILNVLLYSLFTIGFLCRITFKRSTL